MVFISYSHDSDELCDKVLELSNHYRSKGIDCIIDQYEEAPPEGWPRWMEAQIRTAEYVLVICTKPYYEKAILKTHVDSGLGVKWETNLILNQLYSTGAVTDKFIPVVFSNEDVISILEPLKGQTYYNVAYDQRKDALRNRLLGIRQNKKPPIGSIEPKEDKPQKPDARLLITGVIDTEVWDKAKWTGVGYLFDLKSPPYLGIWHKDLAASRKIFADWKNRFGDQDKNDEIYISIIEKDDSLDYFVHLGADLAAIRKRLHDAGIDGDYDVYLLIDRWHHMEIVDKLYLDTFKQEFIKHGCYYFCPIKNENGKMSPILDLRIKKTKINFRKLSEVNEGDYDYHVYNLIK